MTAPFDDGSSESVEVRVNLLRKAWNAVEDLSTATALRKTDVINRAVQFYCMVEMERRVAGTDVAWVKPDGKINILSFSDDPDEVKKRFEEWSDRFVRKSWLQRLLSR